MDDLKERKKPHDEKVEIFRLKEMYRMALSDAQLKPKYNDLADFVAYLNEMRKKYENYLNITPLKEFGTNYAEFYRDGTGAVKKLLAEADEAAKNSAEFNGQVAGAFYRDELGDIDLVWGDSSKGLKHILERRAADFEKQGLDKAAAAQKAREFAENLSDIVEKGDLKIENGRAIIDTGDKMGIISLDYYGTDKKWLITAYNKYDTPPSPPRPAGFVQNEVSSPSNQLTSAKTGLDGTNSSEKNLQSQVLEKTPQAKSNYFKDFSNRLYKLWDEDFVGKMHDLKDEINKRGFKKFALSPYKYKSADDMQTDAQKAIYSIDKIIKNSILSDFDKDVETIQAALKQGKDIDFTKYTITRPAQNAEILVNQNMLTLKNADASKAIKSEIIKIVNETMQAANKEIDELKKALKGYSVENSQNLGENLAKNGENSAAQTQKNLIDEPQAQKAEPASEPKTDETPAQNATQTPQNAETPKAEMSETPIKPTFARETDKAVAFEVMIEYEFNASSSLYTERKRKALIWIPKTQLDENGQPAEWIWKKNVAKAADDLNPFSTSWGWGYSVKNSMQEQGIKPFKTAQELQWAQEKAAKEQAKLEAKYGKENLERIQNAENEFYAEVDKFDEGKPSKFKTDAEVDAAYAEIQRMKRNAAAQMRRLAKKNAQNLGENLAKNGENLSDLGENSAAQTQKNLIDKPQAQKAAENAENSQAKEIPQEIQPQAQKAAENAENSQEFTQISTNGASDSPSVLRQEAEARIDELINNQTQIVNKNDGRVAQISVEGRKKMLGTRALEKSIGNKFKARHHFKACEKIQELFEKSEFLESEPPKNGSADIKAVHRYVANVEIDGKQAQALLTLKENASDEIGNRIYSLELQELRPLPNAQARTELTQQGQSNLTLAEDASAKSTSEAIEKTDKGIIPQNETKSQALQAPKGNIKEVVEYKYNEIQPQKKNIELEIDNINKQQKEFENKAMEKLGLDEREFAGFLLKRKKHKITQKSNEFGVKREEKIRELGKIKKKESRLARLYRNIDWIKRNGEKLQRSKDNIDRIFENEIRIGIQETLDIKPLREFGYNYAEFYHDGTGAVKKLLAEADEAAKNGAEFNGQVAGAFYRDELGDIDLVWGNDEIGLKKIKDKHLGDFADFDGETPTDKLTNGLNEIVEKGTFITENGVETLYLSKGNKYYLVGLSKGYDGKGENKWIITSYEAKNLKPELKEKIGSADKTLSADTNADELQTFNSTADSEIIPNSKAQSQGEFEKISQPQPERPRNPMYEATQRKNRINAEWREANNKMEREKFLEGYTGLKESINKFTPKTPKEKALKRVLERKFAIIQKYIDKAPNDFQRFETPKNKIAEISYDYYKYAVESSGIENFDEKVAAFVEKKGYYAPYFKGAIKAYLAHTKLNGETYESLLKAGANKEKLDDCREFLRENGVDLGENLAKNGENLGDLSENSAAQTQKNLIDEPQAQKAAENAENSQAKEIQLKIQQKFGKDENYARDLYEWHKDSSPLTKDEDGTPKVFYHGTNYYKAPNVAKDKWQPHEVFEIQKDAYHNIGHWFAPDYEMAKGYADNEKSHLYEVFLNIKKPFIMEKELTPKKIAEIDEIFKPTKAQKERGLKVVERFKKVKQELEKNGYEFVDRWREETFIKDKETGEIFRFADSQTYDFKKSVEDLNRYIKDEKDIKWREHYKKDKAVLEKMLKKGIKKLDKLNDFVARDRTYYFKDYFKNETELYLLYATDKAVEKAFNKYFGYSRWISTRLQPYADFYKKAGYDGIQFNENEFVVFDSNQIKAVENKGGWTDGGGNITPDKPQGTNTTHKYFNESSPNIYRSSEIWGSGLAGGTLNGLETDEDGNIIGFNPQNFIKGFLVGAGGAKAVKLAIQKSPAIRAKAEKFAEKSGEYIKETLQNSDLPRHARNAFETMLGKQLVKAMDARLFIVPEGEQVFKKEVDELVAKKVLQKEQKGIYNVAYNGKNATFIKSDLQTIDDLVRFAKGDRAKGALHIINKHLNHQGAKGYINEKEITQIGQNLRAYLKDFKEPLFDERGARIYEWQDSDKVRHRLVLGGSAGGGETTSHITLTANNEIVTYYSDRNTNKMNFQNPKVAWKFKENNDEYFNSATLKELKNKIHFAEKQGIEKNELEKAQKYYDLWHNVKANYDFNDKKAKDLIEWHKDSDKITKYGDDEPILFYHGTRNAGLQVFDPYFDSSRVGFWVTSNDKLAESFAAGENGGVLNLFVKMKKPLRADKFLEWSDNKEIRELTRYLPIPNHETLKESQKTWEELKSACDEIEDLTGFKVIELLAEQDFQKGFYDSGEFNAAADGIERLIVQNTQTGELDWWYMKSDEWDGYLIKDFLQDGDKAYKVGNTPIIRSGFDIFCYKNYFSGAYLTDMNTNTIDIKEILEKLNYDGIVFNNEMMVAFDSKQLKALENKGSWIDRDGNTTPQKPRDAKGHNFGDWQKRYFNESSPNIYRSSEIWGSGLAGGTLNGLETDEDGNIIGFNPQNFIKGFLVGAGGAKAVKLAIQKSPAIRAKAEKFAAKSAEFLNEALQNPLMLPQNRARFAVVANKALNSALDNRKFIIGGEGAIGANREKLARARVMQKQGKDEGEIWDKTGWYLDKDGKWKFEINAAGGEWIQEPTENASGKLSDFLDDEELFKAYPKLKETKIHFMNLSGDSWLTSGTYGVYSPTDNLIVINSNQSIKDIKSTLYHEIQHAVQEIEGFAKGGDIDTYDNFTPKQKEAVENLRTTTFFYNETSPFVAYKALHGETEARNVQGRLEEVDFLKRHYKDEMDTRDERIKEFLQLHPHRTADVKTKDTFIIDENGKISQNFAKMSAENLGKGGQMEKDKLSAKITSDLSKEELDALPIASSADFSEFLDKVAKKDYKNTPIILKIATLNDDLKALINKNQNANVFITRARAGHIGEQRKGAYNQALRTDEQRQIPTILQNAKEAYTGGGDGFVLPFADKQSADKINLIVLNSDYKGNFLITAKKINKIDFSENVYKKASKDGS